MLPRRDMNPAWKDANKGYDTNEDVLRSDGVLKFCTLETTVWQRAISRNIIRTKSLPIILLFSIAAEENTIQVIETHLNQDVLQGRSSLNFLEIPSRDSAHAVPKLRQGLTHMEDAGFVTSTEGDPGIGGGSSRNEWRA